MIYSCAKGFNNQVRSIKKPILEIVDQVALPWERDIFSMHAIFLNSNSTIHFGQPNPTEMLTGCKTP